MKRLIEYGIIVVMGGSLYMLIEVLWRGHTHWSMAIAGSICFTILYVVHNKMVKYDLFQRAIAGAVIITVIEFAAGALLNLHFGLDVWDYSGVKYNILGQICPQFSAIWFALSLVASPICRIMNCLIMRKLEGSDVSQKERIQEQSV